MPQKINSLDQLESTLLPLIADALNEVAEKARDHMKKRVDTDVYAVGDHLGRKHYHDGAGEPTYQLRDSIVNTVPEIKGKEVTAKVKHDTDLMGFNADTFLHGSKYYSPNDVRDLLPMFIDTGATGGIFGDLWANLKRPYFTNTKDELEAGLFQRWMDEALRKRGIYTGVTSSMG